MFLAAFPDVLEAATIWQCGAHMHVLLVFVFGCSFGVLLLVMVLTLRETF